MSHKRFEELCNIATEAHTRFQKDIEDIDPIVGVNQNMRKKGVPADVMTIDCIKNGKRIILVLRDELPDSISYLYSWRDKDPEGAFTEIPFDDFSADTLLEWMKGYIAVG